MSNDKSEDGEIDKEDYRFQDFENYNEQSRSLVRVQEVPPDDFQEDHCELSPVESEEDATFPRSTWERVRTNRHYSRVAAVVGISVRIIVASGITAEDTASIIALLFYLISLLSYFAPDLFPILFSIVFTIVVLITTGILSLGDLAVTWAFWTPPVQDQTAAGIDRVIGFCYPRIQAQEQRVNQDLGYWSGAIRLFRRFGDFTDRISRSLAWLIFVSISCSIATLGSVSNENEEGLRMLIGWESPRLLTAMIGLGLGLIATVYSGLTDLSFLWRRRSNSRAVERPSKFIILIAILGSLEYFFRMWLVVYLIILERWDNRVGAALISILSNVIGAIPILLYQTVVAIERSPFLLRVKLILLNMPLPAKIIFLTLICLNTILQNMCLTYFNMSTLLPDIFNERFGYAINQAWFNLSSFIIAVVVTLGDLLSSFLEGVVPATMGWDQPDNLFLGGARSQPLYGRRSLRFQRHEGLAFFDQQARVTVLPEEQGQPSLPVGRLSVNREESLEMANRSVDEEEAQMSDNEDIDALMGGYRKK
jgi:hypothetical protein